MKNYGLISVILLIASCTSAERPNSQDDFRNLTRDSILLNELHSNTKALNIAQIFNGVDSFEFRIWHGISIATPNHLTILQYQDSSWTLTHYDYWLRYQWVNGAPNSSFADSVFIRSKILNDEISGLVDTIYQFQLDSFPSQKDIPDFRNSSADGMYYVFEIATPRFYKALSYNNPNSYNDSYNKQIAILITRLKKIGVTSMQ